MNYVKACFAKYATFQGRARRTEFLAFLIFYYVGVLALAAVFMGLAAATGIEQLSYVGTGLIAIFFLICIIPSISVQVRRLHDTNKSGWFMFVSFIPFVGVFIFLFFLLSRGDVGENRFGPDPKA